MSYTQAEVEILKESLKEICNETYFPVIHELRKKLATYSTLLHDLQAKCKRYEENMAKLEECHKCHTSITIFHDTGTQTYNLHNGHTKESTSDPEPSTSDEVVKMDGLQLQVKENVEPKIETHQKATTPSIPGVDPELICISSDSD